MVVLVLADILDILGKELEVSVLIDVLQSHDVMNVLLLAQEVHHAALHAHHLDLDLE